MSRVDVGRMGAEKRGAIDWTVGKLLSLILAVLLLLLIIYGFSTGSINPLKEKIRGQIDSVLLLINSIRGGGGGSSDCLTFNVKDKNGGEVLSDNLKSIGKETDDLKFKICRDGVCALDFKKTGKSYSLDVTSEKYDKMIKDPLHLEVEQIPIDKRMDYWRVYKGMSELVKEEGLEVVFDFLFNDVHIFYSWAYDEEVETGLSSVDEKDNLMYAVGWDGYWNVYAVHGGRSKILLKKVSTEEMAQKMRKNTDNGVMVRGKIYNNPLYYKTDKYSSIKGLLDGVSIGELEKYFVADESLELKRGRLAWGADDAFLTLIRGKAGGNWAKELLVEDLIYVYDSLGNLQGKIFDVYGKEFVVEKIDSSSDGLPAISIKSNEGREYDFIVEPYFGSEEVPIVFFAEGMGQGLERDYKEKFEEEYFHKVLLDFLWKNCGVS